MITAINLFYWDNHSDINAFDNKLKGDQTMRLSWQRSISQIHDILVEETTSASFGACDAIMLSKQTDGI